jgi:transposase
MAGRKQYEVGLTEAERSELESMSKRGVQAVREVKRAQVLLGLAAGKTYQAIHQEVGMSLSALQNIAKRYQSGGIERALHDAPRPGRVPRFTGEQRAKITALACSTPSDGHAQWSLRLLADKVVELEIAETIHHETIRTILKKTP